MDEKYDSDKVDEMMLPGFRFHPTDEELVGFYLKRKVQQRPLSIELIKQLDIYKYDPWDLPKLATTGEKEWYFYCPRDRKYRNSARPNRVTGAGFWKATGTDRPIYSSEGTKCIGLKKSLVFYTGRAAKGVKTDWMMHEFRLPAITNSSPPRRFTDRSLPLNDSWAICRIFKKTNSMAQRALSHSWVSPVPDYQNTHSDLLAQNSLDNQFSTENISCITAESREPIHFGYNNDLSQQCSTTTTTTTSFSPVDISSYNKHVNHDTFNNPCLPPIPNGDLPAGFLLSSLDMSVPAVDVASMLLNLPPGLLEDTDKDFENIDFGGTEQLYDGFSITLPQEMQGNMGFGEDETWLTKHQNKLHVNDQWGTFGSVDFPFGLPSLLPWDYLPFPSEVPANHSTNKCNYI